MLFRRANVSQQRARDLFLERGADLDHVDVVVDTTIVRSYCVLHEDESIEVAIGLGLQLAPRKALDWFILHEFAHAWWFTVEEQLSKKDLGRWIDFFGPLDGESEAWLGWNPFGKFHSTEFVSWYATTSSHEDFAETTASFISGLEVSRGRGLRAKKVAFVKYLLGQY